MTEKYPYRLICNNCLNSEDVEIEYGYTVDDFRNDYKCKKCGCGQ